MYSTLSMYFHNLIGTGSYTTSTTNMDHKDRFYVLARTGTVVAVVRHSILFEPISLTHSAAGGAKRVGWQSSSMTAVSRQ